MRSYGAAELDFAPTEREQYRPRSTTAKNAIADIGSRDPEFERRWRTDVYREAMLRPALLGQVAAGLRCSFTVDAFCDRRGWTALAPRWR